MRWSIVFIALLIDGEDLLKYIKLQRSKLLMNIQDMEKKKISDPEGRCSGQPVKARIE